MLLHLTVVYHMRTILNFAIAFGRKYNEQFVATRLVDIPNNMIGSDFLTGMGS